MADFPNVVANALALSGLDPRCLELEITESVLVDTDAVNEMIKQLRGLGVRLSLDDFGTGYSSLAYLRDFRFSTIKIDRTFVQGAAQNNAESIAIVRAVVAMAESLQMTTTAEGVEDADEARLIREMGCTKIQGYYFGRPMPTEEAYALAHRAGPLQPAAIAAA
jgi:EAL domain-containing protein (putative c-di-GMP-specific phosphodiesterase class I)